MASSVWHEGATITMNPNYQGSAEGYMDRAFGIHQGMLGHNHQIHQAMIDVRGDRAVSETAFTAILRVQPEPGRVIDMISRGRYLDRWSRRDGRWAIDDRLYLEELREEVPVSDAMQAVPTDGRRGPDDPLYAARSELGSI
jgi:hypothetical protein